MATTRRLPILNAQNFRNLEKETAARFCRFDRRGEHSLIDMSCLSRWRSQIVMGVVKVPRTGWVPNERNGQTW